MMNNRLKASIKTMLASVLYSASLLLANFIFTRLLLLEYGSEPNGLISTLTQFVSFFSILEGGITTAAVVAAYEPSLKGNYEKLNEVLSATDKVFNVVSLSIAALALPLGSLYIKYIDSPYSYLETFSLLLVSIMTTVGSLQATKYTVLLQSYNKGYLISLFLTVAKLVSWAISIVLIYTSASIIFVHLCSFVNVSLSYLLLWFFCKSRFKFIDFRGKRKTERIAGSKDVMFQKACSTLFSSTDLILISGFISLASASIYNLYALIFRSVSTFMDAVVNAPMNSFGQMIKEDFEKFKKVFSAYECLMDIVITTIMLSAAILTLPFLKLYTSGVDDLNYIYPSLTILFFNQYYIQLLNRPYGILLNISGNFRMQNKQCAASAIINLILSVALIRPLGIAGVVIGSVVGTIAITVVNLWQATKHILKERGILSQSFLYLNVMISNLILWLSLQIPVEVHSYLRWIGFAVLVVIGIFIVEILLHYLLDKKRFHELARLTRPFLLKLTKNQQEPR